uniref:PH domain-containing protein n=1 Tax=Globisporangium ultimum (strain ATCC 200006 / CBS 805.95 / DAOM BR144) TaxID=431595 RepID=K3WD90_GLOUD
MAHLSRFSHDIDELERLSMIRRIDNFVGGVPLTVRSPSGVDSKQVGGSPNIKVKFEFGHGFMQDVIRSQMLCSQLDKLHSRISDFREMQQKELRQKFFEKAKGSLNPQMSLTINPNITGRRRGSTPPSTSQVQNILLGRRALTPTDGRHFSLDDSAGITRTYSSVDGLSVSLEASNRRDSEDGVTPRLLAPQLKSIPTFMLLKSGNVYVKKQSSLFSHFKVKGMTNARMWKKRYAVLQNARLLVQYDEQNGSQPRQGTSLFLKGAKVSACDPEVASKVNCFQIEVKEWTKGKYLMNERRFFVMGVESEAEVEDWVYMIRYAIESLENQS